MSVLRSAFNAAARALGNATKGFFEAPSDNDNIVIDAIDHFFSDEEHLLELDREFRRRHTPVNRTPTTTIRTNPEHAERVDWAREGF